MASLGSTINDDVVGGQRKQLSLTRDEMTEIDTYCGNMYASFKASPLGYDTDASYLNLLEIRVFSLRDKISPEFERRLPRGNLQDYAAWRSWLQQSRNPVAQLDPAPDWDDTTEASRPDEVRIEPYEPPVASKITAVLEPNRKTLFRLEAKRLMPDFAVTRSAFLDYTKACDSFKDFEVDLFESGILTLADIKRAEIPAYYK